MHMIKQNLKLIKHFISTYCSEAFNLFKVSIPIKKDEKNALTHIWLVAAEVRNAGEPLPGVQGGRRLRG